MNLISVVLIAKNEAHIIGDTIKSVLSLTDDIIVVDSGSTDGTQDIVRSLHGRLIETGWDGFGNNKNKGIEAARYDWILSIDSDEMPDEGLLRSLQTIDLTEPNNVYNIRFKTFLGARLIRYGEWGKDAHVRLFNRKKVKWNNAKVHEQLVLPDAIKTITIQGYIMHYTMKDLADYSTKMTKYALLNAERYHHQGKRAGWIKRRFSPKFAFFQNYILRGGFLDGREGYLIARMTAYYTFLKYERLYELCRSTNKIMLP